MSSPSIVPLLSAVPTAPSGAVNTPGPGGFGDLFEQALTSSVQPAQAAEPEDVPSADEAGDAPAEVSGDRDAGDAATEESSASESEAETESTEDGAPVEDSSDKLEISEEAVANQASAEEAATNQQSSSVEPSAELLGEATEGESTAAETQDTTSDEEGDQQANSRIENEDEPKSYLGETAQRKSSGESDGQTKSELGRDAVSKSSKGEAGGNDQDSNRQQETTEATTETAEPEPTIKETAVDQEDLESGGPRTRLNRGSQRASSATQNAKVAEVAPLTTKAESQAQLDAARFDTTQLTASQSTQLNSTQGVDSAAVLNSITTASSATEATGTETEIRDTPTVDKNRFLGRVSGALKAAQQRDGRIQVRLAPPELGLLRIELSVQQGSLTASLETETNAAKSLLLDNLPALRERLAEQDIRVEKFDVDVRRDGQQAPDHELPGERQPQNPGKTPARAGISMSNSNPGSEPSGEPVIATTDAGLDIRV